VPPFEGTPRRADAATPWKRVIACSVPAHAAQAMRSWPHRRQTRGRESRRNSCHGFTACRAHTPCTLCSARHYGRTTHGEPGERLEVERDLAAGQVCAGRVGRRRATANEPGHLDRAALAQVAALRATFMAGKAL
jgi:hypothetical protein